MKVYAEHYFKTKGLTAEVVNHIWEKFAKTGVEYLKVPLYKTLDGEVFGDFIILLKQEGKKEPYLKVCYFYGAYGYGGKKTYLLK